MKHIPFLDYLNLSEAFQLKRTDVHIISCSVLVACMAVYDQIQKLSQS